jgi:hypothetical protein
MALMSSPSTHRLVVRGKNCYRKIHFWRTDQGSTFLENAWGVLVVFIIGQNLGNELESFVYLGSPCDLPKCAEVVRRSLFSDSEISLRFKSLRR